jgi:hypothetical protein
MFAFFRTKRFEKGIDGGKWEKKLKNGANPYHSPLL